MAGGSGWHKRTGILQGGTCSSAPTGSLSTMAPTGCSATDHGDGELNGSPLWDAEMHAPPMNLPVSRVVSRVDRLTRTGGCETIWGLETVIGRRSISRG